MKMMKKIAAMLLSVCLLVPCFSMLVYAADGTLQFTDPEATQGKTVMVEGVVRGGDSALGDISVTMTYDTAALEFVSGENVSGSDGTLTYKTTGDGSETEIRFGMKFNVLTAGETVIKATDSVATLNSGDTLNLTLGTSTVKASEGDGTTSYETPQTTDTTSTEGVGKITINGVEYSFSEDFKATDIPEGYEETTLTYEGAEHKFVKNAESNIVLGYLVNAEGNGEFFLYDQEANTFAPFVVLYISDTTSIVLLSDVSAVKLPKQYQSMELTVNDKVFPAWQDMENDGFYVLYALDGTGNKMLYQYDNTDGTYQRFVAPEVEEESKTAGLIGKIKEFVQNNFILVLLALAVFVVFFLILLIVLGVKLHHRNSELDDLYDEYDIPDDVGDSKKKDKKANKNLKSNKKQSKYDDDDDFFDEDDEFFDDDDEYLDDDDEYYDDDFESDEYYDEDEAYYDDEFYEDEVEEKSAKAKKSSRDEYDIDFIDI